LNNGGCLFVEQWWWLLGNGYLARTPRHPGIQHHPDEDEDDTPPRASVRIWLLFFFWLGEGGGEVAKSSILWFWDTGADNATLKTAKFAKGGKEERGKGSLVWKGNGGEARVKRQWVVQGINVQRPTSNVQQHPTPSLRVRNNPPRYMGIKHRVME